MEELRRVMGKKCALEPGIWKGFREEPP